MTTELHYASLLDVSQRIAARTLSSEEVTRALLARIDRLDPALRSYLFVAPELALDQARAADREVAAGFRRGPLHGVPIAIKDLIHTRDMPTSAGMAIHRDFRPDADATVVQRLKAAGAVILGKLHMAEGATIDHHPDLPRPEHPWAAGRWTGISSSGSGVATAAGLCFGALGTDTGGSIRMPSASCGLSGIKPTWGRVSRHGVFPLSESLDHVGPMARTVADAAAMLGVMAGRDAADPTTLSDAVPAYLQPLGGGIDDLVIGVDHDYALAGAEPVVAEAFTEALRVLADLGARIRPVELPPLPTPQCLPVNSAEFLAAHAATFPARREEYGPLLGAMLDAAADVTPTMVGEAWIARLRWQGALAAMFQDIDMLATPAFPCRTPMHDEAAAMLLDPAQMNSGLMRFTIAFNFSGSPTLSLPCGFDALGLPLGLQLVGRHLGEVAICRAGDAYQRVTAYHTRHPAL